MFTFVIKQMINNLTDQFWEIGIGLIFLTKPVQIHFLINSAYDYYLHPVEFAPDMIRFHIDIFEAYYDTQSDVLHTLWESKSHTL